MQIKSLGKYNTRIQEPSLSVKPVGLLVDLESSENLTFIFLVVVLVGLKTDGK